MMFALAVTLGTLTANAQSPTNTYKGSTPQEANGDVQNPINPNDDANFEAGAKKHDNLWDKWDD